MPPDPVGAAAPRASVSLSGGSGAKAAVCTTPSAISAHAPCAGRYPSPINPAAAAQSARIGRGASKRSASRATAGAAVDREELIIRSRGVSDAKQADGMGGETNDIIALTEIGLV